MFYGLPGRTRPPVDIDFQPRQYFHTAPSAAGMPKTSGRKNARTRMKWSNATSRVPFFIARIV
jgi:hypothetical protein